MSAGGQKSLRLMNLERWAREKYRPEEWGRAEFKAALEEYSLITWGVSEGASKNMAKIVQLRMTRTMPKSLVSAEPSPEAQMLVSEILMTHRATHPEEYKVPKTEFEVVDE